MILRLLIFILTAILFAFAVSALAGVDERMLVEVFGLKISIHAGVAIGLAIFVSAILVLTTSFAKDVTALPGKVKAARERAKLDRGMAALARGMEAVAIGDASDASHHARVAHRNLGDGSITRLLTAQAAQLSGDDETAGKSFEAMLEAPETEFLGLRGLYGKATRAGDKDAARGYAERAYSLRPNAAWAFESVFDLALERGAWGDARAALGPAVKNKTIEPEKARRAEAALLTASAYAAEASGDASASLEEAELALKSAPGLPPAAVLAARLHHAAGRDQRGVKILEQAFAAFPHVSLVTSLLDFFADAPKEKAAEALRKLAARNPSAREASLAQAQAHILKQDYASAIATLEPLLERSASARDCSLMAEAVGGAHGEAAARPWLQRAASALRDPTPGADGRFRFTREGWAQLIRSYMEDERLGPDPVEGPPAGLEASEIRLLAAPRAITPEAANTPEMKEAADDNALRADGTDSALATSSTAPTSPRDDGQVSRTDTATAPGNDKNGASDDEASAKPDVEPNVEPDTDEELELVEVEVVDADKRPSSDSATPIEGGGSPAEATNLDPKSDRLPGGNASQENGSGQSKPSNE